MNNHRKLLEIETNDFVFLRQELKRIADSMVDEQINNSHERREGKTEIDKWLNRLFSNLPGGISLIDNPNFNVNDPITAEGSFNEALAEQVQQAKKELEVVTEKIVETRTRTTQVLAEVVASIVEVETEEALLETIIDTSQTQKHIERMDKYNIGILESDFDEAIGMLTRLDKSVPTNVRKFNSISDVLDSNK